MDEPIEDGVRDGGVGDDLVPIFDRHLAGDDGRSALVAIIDDFEEIATLPCIVGGVGEHSGARAAELFEAFERNDLSGWPRGLYSRAWIRGYATVIGLDAIDTVDEFCRLFPQGDRRMASTVQEVAAIVAHPS